MPSLDHFNRIKCLICAKCCFGLFPRDGGGKGGVQIGRKRWAGGELGRKELRD